MENKYILETKSKAEWQKQLNQWKHKYDLYVISMLDGGSINGILQVTILLLRTEKE